MGELLVLMFLYAMMLVGGTAIVAGIVFALIQLIN